jgi:CheY-like chemotaxis protein
MRILIVEDDSNVREGLVSALQGDYPDWQIDEAESVNETKRKILSSIEDGRPYDLTILDYHLPENKAGEHAEGSPRLTDFVVRNLPDALIIQATAYNENELIESRLLHPNLQIVFIKKDANSTWVKKMSEVAGQRLFGDPIAKQLDEIFGFESPVVTYHRSRLIRSNERVSLTQNLASLRCRIIDSWDYLSPTLKDRIKTKFKVDEKSRPLKITLFDEVKAGE